MRQVAAALAAVLAIGSAIGGCSLPGPGCQVSIAAVDAPDVDAIPADAEVLVTSADIDPAGWRIEQVPGGEPTVTLRLRPEAAERVAEHTAASVGSFLAVEVDDRVVVTPMISSAIEGGEIQLTGGLDTDIVEAFGGCLPVEILGG
jgi:preprotein translocase subunit SecD